MREKEVGYHLRINLVPEHFEQDVKALWRIIRNAKIDEVVFFVPHAEERSPGMGTLDECRRMAGMLAPLFSRLKSAGIPPSINVWWTFSFSDFPALPRDLRTKFQFKWAVNVDGKESHAVACPLDPTWRNHIKEMYRIFAALTPVHLWIDDDARMTFRADMQSPCFCLHCIAEMEKRTGISFTRVSLLEAILANPPNSVRNRWLDFQDQTHREIVQMLADTVHEVSPETSVCLMHSSFEIHAAEGRRWSKLVAALGEPAPMFRPGIGPYQDTRAPEIVESFNQTRIMQAVLPPGIRIAPEIENYPHTRFYKSDALTAANILLAQTLGISDITLSVYRFGGGLSFETRTDRGWEKLLGSMKPCLEAIAALDIKPEQAQGVGLYFNEETCRHTRQVQSEKKPIFLYRQRPWDQVLPILGFATRYGTSNVTAFAGEQIACLDENGLHEAFSRGVLMDSRAAETLLLAGKGAFAGITGIKEDAGAVTEIPTDEKFGMPGDVINTRWEMTARQFEWMSGAKEVSIVRDYSGARTGSGVVLFENSLGGRIAVFPFDSQRQPVMSIGVSFPPYASASFLCPSRQAQLYRILMWLNRKPLPLFVLTSHSILPLCFRQDKRVFVSVTNLSADRIDNLILYLADYGLQWNRIRILDKKGKWKKPSGIVLRRRNKMILLKIAASLGCFETASILLE